MPYNGLCFTAQEANSTVELTKKGTPSIANTAYSLDGDTWVTFTPSTTAGRNKITLANVGDKVYFRNDITGNFSNSNYLKFVMSGKIAASGNINSMYDSNNYENLTTLTYTYCYRFMFDGCTSLTTAPNLPATTLANSCYNSMFYGCTSLTAAPELPATTLADSCYSSMFSGCTSVTVAPELPVTTLANNCYERMFYNCTSLTAAPELPATTLMNSCYSNMFSGCTSLTTAPELPATTLVNSCYGNMFDRCTSLTVAPELPATTLAGYCYSSMFYGCTSLKVSKTQTDECWKPYRIPTSGAGTTATNALNNMFFLTGGTFKGTPTINTTYYIIAPHKTINLYNLQCFKNNLDIIKQDKLVSSENIKTINNQSLLGSGNLNIAPVTNITYASLKSLRDNSQMIPGMFYRITDYVTTSVQTNTRSAGHPFDILIQALDVDKLSENGSAVIHNGDTYFAGYNLSAWEIKYDLDNDTAKYSWADATNGKGVIYYLKDEFNNECCYDFKNIQYLGSSLYHFSAGLAGICDDSLYYYTFSHIDTDNSVIDFSLCNGASFGDGSNCVNNDFVSVGDDDNLTQPSVLPRICIISPKNTLNDIICNKFNGGCFDIVVYTRCQNSVLHSANNIFVYGTLEGCQFYRCYDNILNCNGQYIIDGYFGAYCSNNTLNLSGSIVAAVRFEGYSYGNNITVGGDVMGLHFYNFASQNTLNIQGYIYGLEMGDYSAANSITSSGNIVASGLTNYSRNNTISAGTINSLWIRNYSGYNTITTGGSIFSVELKDQTRYINYNNSAGMQRWYLTSCLYMNCTEALTKIHASAVNGSATSNLLNLSYLVNVIPANKSRVDLISDEDNNVVCYWATKLLGKAGYYTANNGTTWTQITPVETYE